MIVVVPPDAPDSLLDRMAEQQVCGIRFHFFPGGFLTWDDLEPLAARAAVRGWHVQVQLDGTTLAEHAERLSHLPCPLVIDHIGKFTQPAGTDHPGFAALLRLVDGGRTFVKLSAPYETSCEGPPGYADVSTLARALAHHAPERMLWATNWPHPWRKERPSEADLIALLADWVPEEHARALVLVTNPAKLYGFGAM